MDDSMNAFQPHVKVKRLKSLARKHKTKNGKESRKLRDSSSCPIVEQVLKSTEENCELSSVATNTDETLFGVEELDKDEVKPQGTKAASCGGQKELKTSEGSKMFNSESASSPGGLCMICNSHIPKNECSSHYLQCLNKNFSSKSSLTVDLFDTIVCPTCGKDVRTDTFTVHLKECQAANIEAARKISSELITSSYFPPPAEPTTPIIARYDCPNCGVDISLLNASSRALHVNKCLDKQVESANANSITTRSSSSGRASTSQANTCPRCGKVLKSSKGLKVHLGTCKGNESNSKPKRKRKIRVPKNPEEEILQLALGISVSSHTAEKKVKKDEKRRKKEIPIPAMLRVSATSRQEALRARLDSLVGRGLETGDHVIPSTPALPVTNKWRTSRQNNDVTKEVKEEALLVDLPFPAPPSEEANSSPQENGVNLIEEDLNDSFSPTPKLKVLSRAFDPPPPSSDVTKPSAPRGASKWRLTSMQHPDDRRHRVGGLLSQFTDNVEAATRAPASTSDDVISDAVSDRYDVSNEVEGTQGLSSTLRQLIELNKSGEGCDGEEEERCVYQQEREEDPPLGADKPKVEVTDAARDNRVLTSDGTNASEGALRLQEDLSTIINDSSYSDLKVVVGGETFHLHRIILRARCPALLQMLVGGSDGSSFTSRCSRDEMRALLLFIYTGRRSHYVDVAEVARKLGANLPMASLHPVEDDSLNLIASSARDPSPDSSSPSQLGFKFKQSPAKALDDATMDHVTSPSPIPSEDDLFASFTSIASQRSMNRFCPAVCDVTVADVHHEALDGSGSPSISEDPTMDDTVDADHAHDAGATASEAGDHDPVDAALVVSPPRASRRKILRLNESTLNSPCSPPDATNEETFSDLNPSPAPLLVERVDEELPARCGPQHSSAEDLDRDAFLQPDTLSGGLNDGHADADFEILNTTMNNFDVNGYSPGRHSLSQPNFLKDKPPTDGDVTKSMTQPDSRPNNGGIVSDDLDFSVNDSVMLHAALNNSATDLHRPLETPEHARRIRGGMGLVPITPMPNFSDMDTPVIINKGRQIGLKKTLGKKKMKIKLKEHHAYTHQLESEDDQSPDSSQEDILLSSKEEPPHAAPTALEALSAMLRRSLDERLDDSDDEPTSKSIDDVKRKEELETEALEELSDQEYEELLAKAIHYLHERGTLLRALKMEESDLRGFPRGSTRELGFLLERFTTESRHYRREWSILERLSQSKNDVMIGVLVRSLKEIPELAPYQPHLLGVMPVVYRAMKRIDGRLRRFDDEEHTSQ